MKILPPTATHTYWVSIGHSVDDIPQTDAEADQFRQDVRDLVARCAGTILATVDGQSAWEGKPEATTLYLVQLRARRVPTLRQGLATLAYRYGQEAIGLVGSVSPDTLVYAREPFPNALTSPAEDDDHEETES